MATTYEPIATTTLGSATNSVTFSSIPSTYTDLVLVMNYSSSASATAFSYRLNGDTASNYSETELIGNGTSATSVRYSNQTGGDIGNSITSSTAGATNTIVHFMNYSNTSTYKTALWRSNNAGTATQAGVTLWRSTSAINQIVLSLSGSFSSTPTANIGSTFTLYGIKAA
jgi:hypothetical protein